MNLKIQNLAFFIPFLFSFQATSQIEPDSLLNMENEKVIGIFNGVNRNSNSALKWGAFTGSVYFDGYLNLNAARPKDNTQTASATLGRCNEFDISLISIGGKFQEERAWGAVYLQAGNMTNVVHELDPSVNRGWNSGATELEFVREAYAGFYLSKDKKWSTEMGIFNSYIGAESYLVQENWSYQRSMVSDLTPFYFQGAKLIFSPKSNESHEIWLMNGWQAYHRIGKALGVGFVNSWVLNDRLKFSANGYVGTDSRTQTGASSSVLRWHHDHSLQYLWKNHGITINNHLGIQQGDLATGIPKGTFLGNSISHRIFFKSAAITQRVDAISNPGLYLAWNPVPLYPESFYFYNNNVKMIQGTLTYDRFISNAVTFRSELLYRRADRPYFVSRDGTTSPNGWIDDPSKILWYPQLKRNELRLMFAVNFRL